MSQISKYFRLARQVASKGDTKEAKRHYRLGAVGLRSDGAIVTSSNIPHRVPEPNTHAERRLVKKLNWGSTVYVVRIKRDGKLAIARPCKKCQSAMLLRGIQRVYYSINEYEYGVLKLCEVF